MENENCKKCGSTETYVRDAGYDTVLVCRSCQHEDVEPKSEAGIAFEVMRRLSEANQNASTWR